MVSTHKKLYYKLKTNVWNSFKMNASFYYIKNKIHDFVNLIILFELYMWPHQLLDENKSLWDVNYPGFNLGFCENEIFRTVELFWNEKKIFLGVLRKKK